MGLAFLEGLGENCGGSPVAGLEIGRGSVIITNVCDGVMKVTLVMKVLNIKILENTNLVANNQ